MDKRKLDQLRKQAEEMLEHENIDFAENNDAELRATLHELRTHQIELELQNEELLRIQEELVEVRDQYVDLYDFAPVGYLTLNEKDLIVKANLTAAGLLGKERVSLVGCPFPQFIFREDQDTFYKHLKVLTDVADPRACELRLLREDTADWFWARLESVPQAKNEKSGILIRIAVHDITESKRMEAEIMKVKKLEATAMLAGGIAHDFNNLLTIILGNLDLAQEERLGNRSIAKQLQNAREACLSAADLTRKFLTFSSGGVPFKKLAAVEELFTEATSLALAGSNVHPEYSFPEGLWPVEVDADQMILAIGNVLTNARESMPHGGVIRIRAENVDALPGKSRKFLNGQAVKYVKVSIEDGGQGIAKDILPQVYDPYFTSKNTWQKKGLGLGLTVSYSIMKKHGGSIDIASKQNIGTTVSIYLPATVKLVVPQDSEPITVFPLNKKILLMDDEEMLRKVSGKLLETLGYEVELARDGEEAIQKYVKAQQAGSPFGAVILDLTIKGGMGGKETIRRLKELDSEVRAIVISGYADDPIMSNCEAYGFLVALPKPFQLKDLQATLRNILGLGAAGNPVQS